MYMNNDLFHLVIISTKFGGEKMSHSSNENQQNEENNSINEDPFSQLMFGSSTTNKHESEDRDIFGFGSYERTPKAEEQNSQSTINQLKNVDLQALSGNLQYIIYIANELSPFLKQLSPLLNIFSPTKKDEKS
jgi:hypothetical protein